MKVYIVIVYKDYVEEISQVYDSYVKAYDKKKELLKNKYNDPDTPDHVEIIEKEVY